MQILSCNECGHRFTSDPGKHRTYPLNVILQAVSSFNLGHSLTETQRLLRTRAHLDIPETHYPLMGQRAPTA